MIWSILIIVVAFMFLLFVSLNLLDFIFNSTAYPYVKKNLKKGSKVKVGNIEGSVKKIKLTKTKIKSKDDMIIVPNFFIRNNYPK